MRGLRAGAAVVAAVLLAGGAGGCQLVSPGDEDQGPITVGTTDTVTSLDPAGAYDAGSWALFSNVYQSLLTYTPGTGSPVPDAASRCGFQGKGLRTYQCELREGLTFANGHELTTRDVKFSFDRILRIKSSQGPQSLLDTLESVGTEGRTITFRLRVPDATFPFKIATGAGAIVDSTRYPADRLRPGTEADGSGPYVLKSYRPRSVAELRPNKHYQGAVKHRGGEVTVHYFRDSAAMSKAWKERSLDVAGRLMPPADIAAHSLSDTGVKLMESAGSETRSMFFNLRDDSPLKPPAVRRAIAAVVDREALARDVHRRTVEPLYSLIPQGLTGHTTSFFDLNPQPDPESARGILSRAGITTPVRFTLTYSQGAATDEEAALLKRQLEGTGLFEVTTRHVEWTEFRQGYARGDYDAYCVGWLADFPDPDNFTTPLVGRSSSFRTGYANPKVEQLISTAQDSSQRSRVSKDFRAIQEIIAQDVPVLPLWQKKDYVLSSASVSGTQYLSDGTGQWRLWELGRL
ncbi:peptide-binding protein [Streptomyces hiroshimensis]|uniref:Peptide-binding protein n=1 Tax=Streptomyces hiroshimensis TaxID=66424 RepID=A0ABQ2YIT1_9ACTN|nr:ABC transporter substrate-binding protein [Streptomyces hiroshimensis]GGX85448.1 peptide-binding protein [Streptomyces hiroshimensis]